MTKASSKLSRYSAKQRKYKQKVTINNAEFAELPQFFPSPISPARQHTSTSQKHTPNIKHWLKRKKYKNSPSPNIKRFKQLKSPRVIRKLPSPNVKQFGYLKSPKLKGKNLTSARVLFEPDNDDSFEDTDLICDEFCNDALPGDTRNEVEKVPESELHKDELIALIPDVVNEFSKIDGLTETLVTFFRQVKESKFPLDNIAFQLWCEVVKWFKCTSTTEMRYSNSTKTFWKLGWRMFGGRFIHFMSGYKSHGDTLQKLSCAGHYSPESSEVNFAVPNIRCLRNFDPYALDGERQPGVYGDIIKTLGGNMVFKSACLTFDGKKIKQGLEGNYGDIDLIGFESGETLQEKRRKFIEKTSQVDELIKAIQESSNAENICNTTETRDFLNDKLAEISQNIIDAREIKRKKEYCKAKLIERGGESDWRKGRYVYAISAITAFVYDINDYLEKAITVTESICHFISTLNTSKFSVGKSFNLEQSLLYKDIDEISSVLSITSDENTRLLKQRSDEWFKLRKGASVTGSTLYAAVGCDGLGKAKNHFETKVCGVAEKDHPPAVKLAMEHGTKNEVNAVATVVSKIIPTLYPGMTFCEEGSVVVEHNGTPFMVVSPDGSLRLDDLTMESTKVAIEIKCPVLAVHTKFPPRYYLQCLSEIESLGVDHLLYVSWTTEETIAFRLDRDEETFNEALSIALDIYAKDRPKKPSKLDESQRILKQKLTQKSSLVKLIGRFTSVTDGNNLNEFSDKCETLEILLESINGTLETFFELKRERATEAVVFLVADLDRSWLKECIRCAPVAWFPKGYSLATEKLRDIVEFVHTECHRNGIHIPCVSFDGQWHMMVTRSVEGKPMTKLQLHKDVWKTVEKKKKSEIINDMKQMNKTVYVEQTGTHCLVATNSGSRVPVLRIKPRQSLQSPQHNSICTNETENATFADVLPDNIKESSGLDDNVLAMISTDDLEIDAFSGNINEERWESELEATQDADENRDASIIGNNITTQPTLEGHSSIPSIVDSSTSVLSLEDMKCILSLFKTTKNCNNKGKWDNTQFQDLLVYFTSYQNLKTLLDTELRAVVRYLKKTKGAHIKESNTKETKLQKVCELLRLPFDRHTDVPSSKTRKKHTVKRLADLATTALQKVNKYDLNVSYAEFMWPQELDKWNLELSKVKLEGQSLEWFYRPELNYTRQQYEVKCIDSTHLLTRTRRSSCKGHLDGLSSGAWIKVAYSRKTLLTPVMVEDITDPMSVSMAATHFSESVENCMIANGDTASASLCNDIRLWWKSEDDPGIHTADRLQMRWNLRKRLLSHVDFNIFPSPTMHIAGWPLQLWEALIASIDAKAWLLTLCHGGCYNVRAFASMIGETFFSELTMNDRRGQGTVSVREFGQFVGNTMEQLNIRLDPSRTFSYCTKPSTVYKLVEETDICESKDNHHQSSCPVCLRLHKELPVDITCRDHIFDKKERKRLQGRQKESTVSTKRNALQKGSLGVRWEKARTNESKILPDKKCAF